MITDDRANLIAVAYGIAKSSASKVRDAYEASLFAPSKAARKAYDAATVTADAARAAYIAVKTNRQED